MEIIVYALNKPAESIQIQTDNWQNSPVYIGQWLSVCLPAYRFALLLAWLVLAKPTSEKKGRLACWQQYNGI